MAMGRRFSVSGGSMSSQEIELAIQEGQVLYERIKPEESRLESVAGILESADWVFAKTMPDNPHWYTLRDKWKHPENFYAAVLFIRLHGMADWWPDVKTGKAYVALDLNGWHYWTMGDPLVRTWLINRCKLSDKVQTMQNRSYEAQ
jgi:hypothetical protein